jgi:hypothetical protein
MPEPSAVSASEAKAIRERAAAWMSDHGLSQAAMADAVGCSEATLSQVLAGTYEGRTDLYLANLRRWFERSERRERAVKPPPIVRTSVCRHAIAAFERAQNLGVMAAVLGPTGCGKTTAAEWYLKAEPDTIYALVEPNAWRGGHTSYRPLLSEIAAQLGIVFPQNQPSSQCIRDLANALRGSGRLVIVDQADKADELVLQGLRSVWDKSRTGIVLLGTLELIATLRRKRSPTMPEVVRRIALVRDVGGFTVDDAEKLAEPYHLDQAALAALRADARNMISRAADALRMAASVTKDGMNADAIRDAYQSMEILNRAR